MAYRRARGRNRRYGKSNGMLVISFIGLSLLVISIIIEYLFEILMFFVCIGAILILYKFTKEVYSYNRLSNQLEVIQHIEEIDNMSGYEFEQFLAPLFKMMGYTATVTKGSGDFGADLIIKKGQKKCVVQAKCYSSKIGPAAVQEVVAAMPIYKAKDAIVVTNSFFTPAAQRLARANKVKLIDRTELTNMIYRYNKEK